MPGRAGWTVALVAVGGLAAAAPGSREPGTHGEGDHGSSAVPAPPSNEFEPIDVSVPGKEKKDVEEAKEDVGRPKDVESFTEGTMEEVVVRSQKLRYSVNFFGEVLLAAATAGGEPEHPEFQLGMTGIILSAGVGEHLTAMTELVLEGLGDPPATVADLERMLIELKYGPWNVRVGRMHTRVGYWNTGFHHGAWLQPSIERPRGLRFEDDGGLLPVHWIGVEAALTLGGTWGAIQLDTAVGNGRGLIQDDIRTTFALKDTKSLKVALSAHRLLGLTDLSFGAGAIYDEIPGAPATVRQALPDTPMTELIPNAYIAYRGARLTLLAEGYYVLHIQGTPMDPLVVQTPAGTRWGTLDAFGLIGYSFGSLTPYVMVEYLRPLNSASAGLDPFYAPDGAEGAPEESVSAIAGARWDLSNWTCLKLEYRYELVLGSAATHTGVLSWSFGI